MVRFFAVTTCLVLINRLAVDALLLGVFGRRYVYFEKIRVLKAGLKPE